MARAPASEQEEVEEPALPDGAAHVIVAHSTFRGPAPEGYPDSGTLIYEPGDELPFEYGKRSFESWETRLAVLDENGEHLAGGERQRGGLQIVTPDTSDRLQDRDDSPEAAIERWRSGEGFDPSEYEDEDERDADVADGGGGTG